MSCGVLGVVLLAGGSFLRELVLRCVTLLYDQYQLTFAPSGTRVDVVNVWVAVESLTK